MAEEKIDGKAKFDEARAKLHQEKEETEEKIEKAQLETKKAIATQLDKLRANESLADLYTKNAQIGAENLSQELPMLKVHTQGRSTKNLLADGTKPNDGWFFYKPTAEQFEKITCHVLMISRGYKAPGINDGEEKFNQILAGVMVDSQKPFLLFFTGKRLGNMWDFGKEASQYTHAKPVPIPMFAMTVELTTRSEANKFGESWMIDFKILKGANGFPLLVMDEGEFVFLRDQVELIQGTIDQLIASKVKEDQVDEMQPQAVRAEDPESEKDHEQEVVEAEVANEDPEGEPEVKPDEIPF